MTSALTLLKHHPEPAQIVLPFEIYGPENI
jgi:hypothetical protein